MRWLAAAALALGCSGKPAAPAAGTAPAHDGASDCSAMRGKVEQLYRTEARAREPSRVDDAVADNTAMVLADCARAPAKATACIAAAASVAELEARCLAPIDDDGTEGEHAR